MTKAKPNTMSVRTISRGLLPLLAFAVITFASMGFLQAQEPPEDTAPAGEEKKDEVPQGLNPDRSLPHMEPDWWVKAEKPSLPVEQHTLKNGMKVLLLKQGELPLAACYLWYKVGSKDERPGVTGVAHFLEHMMFKGSQHYNKGDVDTMTIRSGGANNAFTSSEYTAYHFTLPATSLPAVLDIERDRMTTLTLDPKEFAAEKEVVLSESRIANDDPTDVLWEESMRMLFGDGHPYSWRVLGLMSDVERMSVDDMRRFWEMYYTPDNATLVIAGGIDTEKTLALVKERFEDLPAYRHTRHRNKAKAPARKAIGRVTRLADVQTPRGEILLPSDSIKSIRNPIRDILASVLADGETSRLYKRLVKEMELCDSVHAYNYERTYGGSFHIGYSLRENGGAEARAKVEAVIFEELTKLANEAPTEDEVKRAIQAREVRSIFGQESADNLASELGRCETSYGDWRFMDHWLETLRRVTPDDVRQVADDWDLSVDPVIGWSLPKERETAVDRAGPVEAPPMPVLDVKSVDLPNGLRLLMLPQPKGPDVFSMQVDFEAGIRTEPADQRGLVELFSATIGAGTSNRSREAIQEAIDNVGGSIGAGSNGVSGRVLARDMNLLLEISADILRNASFPEEEINRERAILLARMKRQPENQDELARRAVYRAVYGSEHPYGTIVAHSEAILNGITRAQLVSHYSHYVAPNNTRIVCVGKFDADELTKKLTELLGDWKRVDAASDRRSGATFTGERKGVQRLDATSFDEGQVKGNARTILVNRPNKEQCAVMIAAPAFARTHADYAKARVLETILGRSPAFSDRFTRILRDEMGLAYSTYAYLTARASEEPGMVFGYIGTSPTQVPVALQGMREILHDTITAEVSDAELETARNYLLSSIVFDLEGSGNLASLISDMDRYQLGWDYLQRYQHDVAAVTKADVLAIARKWIQPGKLVTVVSGELDSIPDCDNFFASWDIGTRPVTPDTSEGAQPAGDTSQG